MVTRAAVYAVLVGILAGVLAAWWDNSPDAAWPSRNPLLFGVAVSIVAFVIGLLVVIAANSSQRE